MVFFCYTTLTMNQKTSSEKKNPFVLMILDGFGLSKETRGNAITVKTAPHIFSYIKKYRSTTLKAHGVDVGLFPGQEGNSEAGHFTIGCGRVVEQDLVRVSRAIHDGTFFKNEAFREALYHAKKYDTAVHVMGLLTNDDSAHSRPEHLYALLELFRREKMEKVYLHLFTDGRDSPPKSALRFLDELRQHMTGNEKIASIMGRFYAMDRAKIWSRTEQAYNTIVRAEGDCASYTPERAVESAYANGQTDEYICPTVIVEDGKPVAKVRNNDVVFFFNSRSDRARQITKAFVQDKFVKHNRDAFKRKKHPKNIRFVAMTDFGPDLTGIFTAFPSPDIDNALAKAIGENCRQLYISESEKYAHVTYFLNGGYPDPINGEVRELIPSPRKYSYAEQPEMHAEVVADRIIDVVLHNEYDFITVNFPNADMVGHTGNQHASERAVSFMDTQVKRIVDIVLAHSGTVVITADHGNAEQMTDPNNGGPLTQHTTNAVPFIIIQQGKKKKLKSGGRLSDVAPTVLTLLGIEKPTEMTGKTLL